MTEAPLIRGELDFQIDAETLMCKYAQTDDCRLFHARKVVELRFKRGDFDAMQYLDAVTKEHLAMKMIETQT